MALTSFQQELIQLISRNRKAQGESYVAGGVALTTLLGTSRLSRDLDLFHDAREAVHSAFNADSKLLSEAGFRLSVEVDRPGYVEALVLRDSDACLLQWAQDSAFRFFPLVEHPVLGLALHPFDLATNKVLALVGRAEPRDWIDIMDCDAKVQPLGYLAWAAAGKDPGLNPTMILEEASRSSRYSEAELAMVEFEGERPAAATLSQEWRTIMDKSIHIVEALPASEVGKCVHDAYGNPVRLIGDDLRRALDDGAVRFHHGSLKGAFPVLA